MDIGYYYVGQIPGRPMIITVRDENNSPVNLSQYIRIIPRLLGSDNEEIDLSDSTLGVNTQTGQVTMAWPPYSVFNKPGDYVFQLELVGPVARDFTTERTIVVRKLGGKK